MHLVVQKFGGSSVATADKLRRVAARIASTRRTGVGVVVVVSAMGKTTDDLLGLAAQVSDQPTARELDLLLASGEQISSSLLAMAVQAHGQDAVALTGAQSGILTSDGHGGAQVADVHPDRIREELDRGRVVVVAGFQGLNPEEEVATLGRGGSDTSAVALASALDAGECQIFTDVAGVYSADPRIVPGARCIEVIDYEQMLALAQHGARVLHVEAVELARRHRVVIQVRSTFGDAGGTRVGPAGDHPEGTVVPVSGIAGRQDLLAITGQGTALEALVLERTHEAAGTERDVILRDTHDDAGRFRLLVASENMADPESFSGRLEDELSVAVTGELGSVSVVGRELEHQRERVERLVSDIALHRFSSPLSLSCLVRAPHVADASRSLHEAVLEPVFALQKAAARTAAAQTAVVG